MIVVPVLSYLTACIMEMIVMSMSCNIAMARMLDVRIDPRRSNSKDIKWQVAKIRRVGGGGGGGGGGGVRIFL